MNGAQLHLLVNHVPVLGVLFSACVTLAGVLRGSDELKKGGLWAFVVTGLSAMAASATGEPAEDVVKHLPDVTKALIHEHEEAAEKALVGALVLGGLSLAALVHAWKTRTLHAKASLVVLILFLPVMALLGYAAHLGGLIRHSELRATIGAPGADKLQRASHAAED
ncbi:MAG: hypothetical protein HYZ74_09265 [Elusimicrobia bacterium]|nr:hypothetical protein [Elusimicrobiota bacterium]